MNMAIVRSLCASILAVMLCGCGYAVWRDIHGRLSPAVANQNGDVLSPEHLHEIGEVLQVADGVFDRHGLDCLSRPVRPNTAKLQPPFVVRACTFSSRHNFASGPSVVPIFDCSVVVNCRDPRVEINLRRQANPGEGPSKEFEAVYSDLVRHLVERVSGARPKVRKHVIF